VIAGVLCGAIICGFGWFMPARTQAGARALEGILGFEDFLNHVEADRFDRMMKTPEMFEKFLPFAMALGVEKNWSKAFQGIYTQPPQWYQGGGYGPNFVPYMFAKAPAFQGAEAFPVADLVVVAATPSSRFRGKFCYVLSSFIKYFLAVSFRHTCRDAIHSFCQPHNSDLRLIKSRSLWTAIKI
jgi:hypothetical protein